MPETFEKNKIVHYVHRLMQRRESLLQQLKDGELVELRQVTLGEVKACDLVIKEITKEFGLTEQDAQMP